MPFSSKKTFRPPRKVKPVKGLTVVALAEEPQFAKTNGNVRGRHRKGLIYQQRVIDWLDEHSDGWEPIPGPWFEFVDRQGHRYAQADWVALNQRTGIVCIGEIKLTRVSMAWWQLNTLYKPLVERLFPAYEVACLEIVANLASVAVPEPVKFITSVDRVNPKQTSCMQVRYDCHKE